MICIVLFAIGAFLHIKPAVVVSGSMAPTMPVGSLILERAVPAEQIGVGDVVTVPRPDVNGLVTHRVVSVEPLHDDIVSLVLKGDANTSEDPSPYLVRDVGLHVATVPLLGYLALFLRTPGGIAAVITGIVVMFILAVPGARWFQRSPHTT